jgi:hypothetical protein
MYTVFVVTNVIRSNTTCENKTHKNKHINNLGSIGDMSSTPLTQINTIINKEII